MPPPLVLREVTWDWSRPYILGIVNVTPDSFSDGGAHGDTERAVAHGERLLAEGADALDVGGESTRPGAEPVTTDEELRRVVPVVAALSARGALVSIDTTKPEVARAALRAGACVVNDVGMGADAAVLGAVAAEHGAAFIAMHARGTPGTMRARTDYADLLADVASELLGRAEAVERSGVPRGRIVLDPGIGFAKHARQSLSLLANIARLRGLGYALCVGPSRKSFIDAAEAYRPAWDVRPGTAAERVGGTAAAVSAAVLAGAEVLRVHDVAVMRQAARVAHAIRRAADASPSGGGGV